MIREVDPLNLILNNTVPTAVIDGLSYYEAINLLLKKFNDTVALLAEDSVIAISNEVIAARDGEVSLIAKINMIGDLISELQLEIQNARGGESLLVDRFINIDQLISDLQDDVVSVGSGVGAINNVKLISAPKFGKIALPNDFTNDINFEMWRDVEGTIKTSFDYDFRVIGWSIFYVSESGNQANDGRSIGLPKKSLIETINEIELDVLVTDARIIVLGDYLTRTNSQIVTTIMKNYSIEAQENQCFMGSIEPGLVWTLHSAGVYKATRSAVVNVFDKKYMRGYNLPEKLLKKNTLAECQASPNAYYTDGTLVYVHRKDNSAPVNSDVFVIVQAVSVQVTFGLDKYFMMRNITHLYGGNGQPYYFTALTNIGRVISDNVVVYSTTDNANGISCRGIKSMWSFNCKAIDIARDGFNYHDYTNQTLFVFEYNCFAENCGLTDANDNNNATTAHDAIKILRVGSKGAKTKGPVCIDANGCYSIFYDCSFRESVLAAGNQLKSGFYFNDEISAEVPAPNGKAILINCTGGGDGTLAINCDTGFKVQDKITIDNFIGKNIPQDINFKIL